MKNKLKLTLLDEHKSALETIAATHKCIALMGPHVGKPSVSALLVAIAAGALSVVDGRMSRDDLASALAADRLEVEKYHAGIAKSGSKNSAAVAKNQDKKPSIRGPLTVAKIPGWVPVGGFNHCGISYLESPKYLARQDSRSVDEWIDLGCTVGRGADSGGREIDVVVGLDDWVLSDSSIGEFLDSLKDLSVENE